MQTPDHTIEYRHNALGNRVAKLKDGQVVERYLWQDKTTLLATFDGQGNLKQRFNYTLGHAPTSFTENGETYYLLTDHLGSPRMITDSAGQVFKAIEYDAYGNVISDSTPGLEIPFGFAGGLRDADTGLIRFGYRDYDPETGRWTARDPIGFAGGDTNLYGYVLSDPVNWIDPRGLNAATIAPGASIGFAVGGPPGAVVGGIIGFGVGAVASYVGWSWYNNKAPDNAYDPDGPKAPGKPGAADGFTDPKNGEKWVPNPNGSGSGWLDNKGNVWCPTGGKAAHGGEHWDVQSPGKGGKKGKHINVHPGGKVRG